MRVMRKHLILLGVIRVDVYKDEKKGILGRGNTICKDAVVKKTSNQLILQE